MSDQTTVHTSGAKSSKCPRMDLIPYEALVRMAARFELGLERYGLDNWRNGIRDADYVRERVSHLMNHCARLLEKLSGRMGDDGEDDVAAILWAGAFLAARTTCACGATILPQQTTCDDCADAVKQVAEAGKPR